MIDASTPTLHPSPGDSEPQNWPALSPKKSGRVREMKEIAQEDPAEQFPVLDKSLSDGSLSSSASTVKVINEGTKLVKEKAIQYLAAASDQKSNELTGCDSTNGELGSQTPIEDNKVIVHEVSILQKASAITYLSFNIFRLPDLYPI